MSVRSRFVSLALAAATAAACIAVPLPGTSAVAAARSNSDAGLFGASDPTYDGVLRQSYALLGLSASGVTPPASSVSWLLRQQCDDGSFMAYRAGNCTAANLTTYTGSDTNSTAAAAIALSELGRTRAARAAVTWLIGVQGRDGGWPWLEGLASDPVSTGLVLQALRSTGVNRPAVRKAADGGVAWIRRHVQGCDEGASGVGGLPFASGSRPDGFSTAEALLGWKGVLLVSPRDQRASVPGSRCRSQVPPAAAMARFIVTTLAAHRGVMPGAMDPTATDWNATALSVLALVAAGYGGRATTAAVQALGRHVDDYALTGRDTMPAALGTLLLVAHATGGKARAFGPRDIDLIARLLDTLRR